MTLHRAVSKTVILSLALCGPMALAEDMSDRAATISLRSHVIDTRSAQPSAVEAVSRRLAIPDRLRAAKLDGSEDYVLVKFAAPVTFEQRQALTDFPSTPAADPHLNNDLDLVVTGPNNTLLGNVFAGGASTTGGAPDRLNTVEQVLIAVPTPGLYTVSVQSFNVPDGPQPYALVVAGDVAENVLIYADGFESGDTSAW